METSNTKFLICIGIILVVNAFFLRLNLVDFADAEMSGKLHSQIASTEPEPVLFRVRSEDAITLVQGALEDKNPEALAAMVQALAGVGEPGKVVLDDESDASEGFWITANDAPDFP
jgi:hypothetical protein